MLRSYGRGQSGLNDAHKSLLLNLALWKISQILLRPFRYRTQCFLRCTNVSLCTENESLDAPLAMSDNVEKGFAPVIPAVSMQKSIEACTFPKNSVTSVYYPANELFKAGKEDAKGEDSEEDSPEESQS